MLTKDKMFQMIIKDPELQKKYEYLSEDYTDCSSGLQSDNTIVRAVAMIVSQISLDLKKDKTIDESALYKKILNYLNTNLLI